MAHWLVVMMALAGLRGGRRGIGEPSIMTYPCRFTALLYLVALALSAPASAADLSNSTTPEAQEIQHAHPDQEIPEHFISPTLNLTIYHDQMDGFNLQLITTGYRLLPPGIARGKQPETLLFGHAHLFINGKKKARIYGDFVHIPEKWLSLPVNQISVFLNSDSHGVWTKNGEQVLATLFIDSSKESPVIHQFMTFPQPP